MAAMCAIGRGQDTSVGANSPATAMLGTGAIGTTSAPVRRNTLLTGGGVGRTGTGSGGTILAPTGVTGKPGGGGSSSPKPTMQR